MAYGPPGAHAPARSARHPPRASRAPAAPRHRNGRPPNCRADALERAPRSKNCAAYPPPEKSARAPLACLRRSLRARNFKNTIPRKIPGFTQNPDENTRFSRQFHPTKHSISTNNRGKSQPDRPILRSGTTRATLLPIYGRCKPAPVGRVSARSMARPQHRRCPAVTVPAGEACRVRARLRQYRSASPAGPSKHRAPTPLTCRRCVGRWSVFSPRWTIRIWRD